MNIENIIFGHFDKNEVLRLNEDRIKIIISELIKYIYSNYGSINEHCNDAGDNILNFLNLLDKNIAVEFCHKIVDYEQTPNITFEMMANSLCCLFGISRTEHTRTRFSKLYTHNADKAN